MESMDFEKVIDSIEKYVREFILYLISFFWIGRSEDTSDTAFDTFNQTVIFSTLSTIAGAYLWGLYIYKDCSSINDLGSLVTDSVLKMLSYGLLLYGLMVAHRMRPHILVPVLAVLRVFSVAHIIAIFGAYLTKNLLWLLFRTSNYLESASTVAATVAYVVQAGILILYMPREIALISPPGSPAAARISVTILFLAAACVVTLAIFLDPLTATEFKNMICKR